MKRRISLQDNTVMPDGRPIWAWENEIEMVRRDEELLKDRMQELKEWGILYRVIRKHVGMLPYNGNWYVEVERLGIAMDKNLKNIEDYCSFDCICPHCRKSLITTK
ncbi:MAG: hypothetical protein V3V81_07870 [Candidatus Bathyarchaeia archaeon]